MTHPRGVGEGRRGLTNSDRGLLATTPCPSGTGPTTPYPLLIKEGNCGKGDHKGHPYNPGLAKGTPWRAPTMGPRVAHPDEELRDRVIVL